MFIRIPWRCRQYISPKRWCPFSRLHGVTNQTTALRISRLFLGQLRHCIRTRSRWPEYEVLHMLNITDFSLHHYLMWKCRLILAADSWLVQSTRREMRHTDEHRSLQELQVMKQLSVAVYIYIYIWMYTSPAKWHSDWGHQMSHFVAASLMVMGMLQLKRVQAAFV
jgi:hypothetical protein